MSTLTVNSSKVAFAASPSISSWSSDYAMQGAWGSDKRVGLIVFGSLRNNVDWSAQAVSQVKLKLTFGNAGASRSAKVLYLHTATRNSAGGKGSAAVGDSLGTVTLSSAGRLTDETITLSETSNAAVFAAMAAWITGGSTSALAIHAPETASSGNYSTNYLNITKASLTVEYELAGSALTVTPTAISPSSVVEMSVTPIEAEGTITHTFRQVIDGTSTVLAADQAVSVTSYTVPTATVTAWFNAMRTAHQSARTITLALDTYVDGALRGTRAVDVSLSVPASACPVIGTWTPRRYASYVDDQAQTNYRDDPTGVDVWADIAASVTSGAAPNCHKASVKVYRWPADDESARALVTTIASSATITSYTLAHSAGMLTGTVPLGEAWIYEVVIDNGYFAVSTQARVDKSTAPLHIAGSGYGVGIGKYSTGTAADPRFEVAWPARFEGGILNVQAGFTSGGTSVAAGGYEDVAITFDQAFSVAPVVVVGLLTSSTAGAFGRCCVSVVPGSTTETGFTARIFNGDSSSRSPSLTWIAVGTP